MSVIFNILLMLLVGFCSSKRHKVKSSQESHSKLPFPHLIDFKESDIGKPYYTFDGVDYDKIPEDIQERDFRNCYEEYTRCTRFTLYANPVCGYHTYQRTLWPYYSICELDLSGCLELQRKNIQYMQGKTYRDRGVYFMGEGANCEIYVRRIAEGLVPRDIRDPQEDVSIPITMKKEKGVLTAAKDIPQDKTVASVIPDNEYDYENIMY